MKRSATIVLCLGLTLLLARNVEAQDYYCALYPLADDGQNPPVNYFYYADAYYDDHCTDGPYARYGWHAEIATVPQDCPSSANVLEFFIAALQVDPKLAVAATATRPEQSLGRKIGHGQDIIDAVMPAEAKHGANRWQPRLGAKTLVVKWAKVISKATTGPLPPNPIWVKVLTLELNLKEARVPAEKWHGKATRTAVFAIEADGPPDELSERNAAPTISAGDLAVSSTSHFEGTIHLPGSPPTAVIPLVTQSKLRD